MRIKEWDYYAVCTDKFALALTIDHNGYMFMDSISLLDFQNNSQITRSKMGLPFLSPRELPGSSKEGDITVKGNGYMLSFENDGHSRHLTGFMNKFSGENTIVLDLHLTDAPKESMVIATLFKDHPEAFYYNQKISCMRVEGMITLGQTEYEEALKALTHTSDRETLKAANEYLERQKEGGNRR